MMWPKGSFDKRNVPMNVHALYTLTDISDN
jgi:hypothetical protein